jgi:hypothetical protein
VSRCEYCGRTNHDDGHGGCYSCGAPVKFDDPYASAGYSGACTYMTCATAVSWTPTTISRKRVDIG